MKYILTLLLFSYYLVSSQTTAYQEKIKNDIKFAKTAAEYGLFEIQSGELAQSKAASEEVKKNSKIMVEEHKKINSELKTITDKKNIELPSSVSTKKQGKYNKLIETEKNSFDKKYAKYMVKDHKKLIYIFKKESKRGKDTELKAWAAAKIPTLRNHLAMWKDTCKDIGK